MALLDLADIPEEVATFEALAVWALSNLARLAQGRFLPVGAGGALVPVCSAVVIEAADGRAYARLEAAIPCSLPDLNAPGGETWMSAGALVGSGQALAAEPPPPPPPPPVDPLFSRVALLLGGTGENGSSTIIDSSSFSRTPTNLSSSLVTTDRGMYRQSSIRFNGNGRRIVYSVPPSEQFLASDFVIDLWLWRRPGGDQCIYDTIPIGGSGGRTDNFVWLIRGDGRLNVFAAAGFRGSSTIPVPSEMFTFISLERVGSQWSYYIGGQAAGGFTHNAIIRDSAMTIGVAADVQSLYLNADVNDLRVTKGSGRYFGTHVVPAAPLPVVGS